MSDGDAPELSPEHVQRMRAEGRPMALVDCREPEEHEIVRIDGAELVPMSRIPGAVDPLRERGAPVVVYCHHGIRSLQAAHYLRANGVDAWSMAGGIDRWAREIDPSKPRY